MLSHIVLNSLVVTAWLLPILLFSSRQRHIIVFISLCLKSFYDIGYVSFLHDISIYQWLDNFEPKVGNRVLYNKISSLIFILNCIYWHLTLLLVTNTISILNKHMGKILISCPLVNLYILPCIYMRLHFWPNADLHFPIIDSSNVKFINFFWINILIKMTNHFQCFECRYG